METVTLLSVNEILKQGVNISITLKANDLIDFANYILEKRETEKEQDYLKSQNAKYLTRLETCDFLKIEQSTLWRYKQKKILMPVKVGGRLVYKFSDIKNLLEGRVK